MSTRSRAALALAALLLAACGVVEPDGADPVLQTSVVPDESWATLERDDFSYRVPPGFEMLDGQPIDSDAVSFVSEGASLGHDYGWYTGPWSRRPSVGGEEIREVVKQDIRIGGHTAEVVSYRRGATWVLRAWWGAVGESHGTANDLLVQGETTRVTDRALLLASIYSVRFP